MMPTRTGLTMALLVLGGAGCGEDPGKRPMPASTSAGHGDGGGTGDETGPGGSSDSAGSGSGGGASTDGDGGGADGPPRFDVDQDTEGGPASEGGDDGTCKKVDLLFVIDDSGSMSDNQVNLVNSFPGFVAEIETELEDVDSVHVGVVTSDPYAHNDPACTGIGALVTQTGGKDAGGQVCVPFVSGSRYLTEADPLAAKFACVGKVGSDGDADEHQAEAAIAAIGPSLAVPGACNEGFVRDDALLVLVIITDEDDGADCADPDCEAGSPGTPATWFDEVVAIKGGVETNVAVVSLLWGMPGNVCGIAEVTEHPGIELRKLTESFTHGFVGDVCAADYSPILHDAVSLIDSACDGFVPPG